MPKKNPTLTHEINYLTLFKAPRLTGRFVKYSFVSEFHKKIISGDAEAVFEKLLEDGVIVFDGQLGEVNFYKLKNELI